MKKTVLISAPKYYGIDSDIKEAFETLGFKTLLINQFQRTILERIAKKMVSKLLFLKPIFNPIIKYFLIKENKEFVSIVSKEMPDLIFIIKGDFVFPATLEKIKKLRSCPVVGYVWDEPFYTHNSNQDDYRKSNFKNGVPLYDFIFVFDAFYIDEIKKQGAKKVQYLPLATNPNRYSEITVTDQDRCDYDYDVCFIGLPFENRVEMFESLRDYKLGVFGDEWTKYFMLKGKKPPSYYKGEASGETVNKIYLSSKIVLNIHHPHSIEGLNTRTFDILACGAFEIVDYKKNVEKHFEIDKEIVTFKSINELKSKIDFYLKNDDLRKTISERGKQKVLNEHTWAHRAKDIVTALK
jgi:spore maturation protein CgeB